MGAVLREQNALPYGGWITVQIDYTNFVPVLCSRSTFLQAFLRCYNSYFHLFAIANSLTFVISLNSPFANPFLEF